MNSAEKYDIIDDKDIEEKDEEFLVKMILKPLNPAIDDDPNAAHRAQNLRKKQRIKKNTRKKDTITLTQMVKNKESKNSKETEDEKNIDSRSSSSESDKSISQKISDENSEDETSKTAKSSSSSSKKSTNLFLSAYEGGTRQKMSLIKLLYDCKPKYVVLYDSQLWFVRQLEVYKAHHFAQAMRVYFLMYINSSEEQRYLTSIRTEKESFEILIKQKATMIIQEEQDGKCDLPPPGNKQKQSIAVQASSRIGGGQMKTAQSTEDNEMPRVIVDMREFRSELPSLLHKRGIHIEPCTLEVGDYVLTPQMCVERKSINDLIESLANGRLYNQCNQMTRSYKIPMLMIEFDANKPFVLNVIFNFFFKFQDSKQILSLASLMAI